MDNVSDLRIVGIDEKRPPIVRKEPYIDLYFRLSHQAPEEWCDIFNTLAKVLDPPVKIDKKEGLFVNAYVRDMGQIAEHLENIKKKVAACTAAYLEALRQRELASEKRSAAVRGDELGPQGRLNAILAGLNYD